ncbi:3-keto-disaccharide hydrolase [Proteiniphilum sp. UBA5384]|uniref:3-keto-disaccharide hydrolase n=1 Tax=Proteiniphilum sp. UBA5384 TaxID=1947279 RepID=UPI0025F4D62F|nr:DUF1080 domain-containing protein [Proteiniphilum sp. UBA5384]
MKQVNISILLGLALPFVAVAQEKQYPERAPMTPEMSEYWQPQPPVVTPGKTSEQPVPAPSDAIILFDGKDLSQWENNQGQAAGWTVANGAFTVKKGTGDIRTKQKFNDFQLHIEWRIPEGIEGKSQGRGNSGVFLQGIYEIQVLDCYENETYVNGQTGSVYKQTPPLVNAMRKPGEWNSYDIIYTAPTFKKEGSYRTPPRVTVLQNGVLLQNNTTILGTTEYIGFPQVREHGAGPISLQDHGDPVSFRNIWIREL